MMKRYEEVLTRFSHPAPVELMDAADISPPAYH